MKFQSWKDFDCPVAWSEVESPIASITQLVVFWKTLTLSLFQIHSHKMWYERMAFILFVCLFRWAKDSWNISGRKLIDVLLEKNAQTGASQSIMAQICDHYQGANQQIIGLVRWLWQWGGDISKNLNIM